MIATPAPEIAKLRSERGFWYLQTPFWGAGLSVALVLLALLGWANNVLLARGFLPFPALFEGFEVFCGFLAAGLVALYTRTMGRQARQLEEAASGLNAKLELADATIASLPGFFVILDARGHIVRCNTNLAEMTGRTDAQLLGADAYSFIVESDRGRARTTVLETLSQSAAEIELCMLAANGTVRTVRWRAQRITYNGRPHLLAIGSDITEARTAEANLRASEETFHSVFDSVNDGIIIHDVETGAFTEVNARVCEMFGYSRDEILKMDLDGLSAGLPPYTLRDAVPLLKQAASGNAITFQWQCKAKDGHHFWIEVGLRRARFGSRDVLLSTARDITERKSSESALLESRQIIEGILDSIVVRVFWKDKNLRYLGCNVPFARDAGFLDPKDVIGKDDFEMGWRDQAELYRADDRSVISSGQSKLLIEEPQTTPDGKTITLLTSKLPLRDANGRVYGVLGTYEDISSRKRTEESLLASQARYRELFESTREAIMTLDPGSGQILSGNPAAVHLFGEDDEQSLVARKPETFAPERQPDGRSSSEKYWEMIDAALRTGTQQFEWAFRRPDGAEFPGEVLLTQVKHSGETRLYATVRDISERKRAAEALAYRDRLHHAITAASTQLVTGTSLASVLPNALRTVAEAFRIDRLLIMQDSSAPAEPRPPRLLGEWQDPDVFRLDSPFFSHLPVDLKDIAAWLAPLPEGQKVRSYADTATGTVARIMHETKTQSILMVPIFVAGGFWGYIGADHCKVAHEWTSVEMDMLETFAEVVGSMNMREQAQVALQASEARFRAVSESAQDAVIIVDSAARISYWNASAARIFGYSSEEAVGQIAHELLAPPRFRDKAALGVGDITSRGHNDDIGKTLEWTAVRKDGVEVPIELTLASMQLEGTWHVVMIMRDVSARKVAEARIRIMARQDFLTGLPNRAVFVEALNQEMARARRGGGAFAVLYLDLDHFKDINDTLGHPIGDLVLQEIAQRLKASARETDIVARFGGDEFAIIVANATDPSDAAIFADKVLKLVNEPCSIQGNDIRTGSSIGIATYGVDTPDAETLLSHADVALYRAKQEGRGTYRFFTEAMDREVRLRVKLGTELREAISAGQLLLMYQPQVDVETGRIVGLEALVRWRRPERGLVSPAEFIPVAEKTGLIVALGSWVMREACRQSKEWLDAGLAVPSMAVNVSALQFKTPHELEESISTILAETGLPASVLELELTESAFMATTLEHGEVLSRIRGTGVHLAIDDFGTGYSSLEYLARLPVDRVKIAQNFLIGMTPNSANAKVVKGAIGLAHDLGLEVVVEGVETVAELILVGSWGGRVVQGFLYSKPLPAGEVSELLRIGKISPGPSPAAT